MVCLFFHCQNIALRSVFDHKQTAEAKLKNYFVGGKRVGWRSLGSNICTVHTPRGFHLIGKCARRNILVCDWLKVLQIGW